MTASRSKPGCEVNFSAPGSSLRMASSAEASSTILLTFGGLAPFENQRVNQRDARLHMSSDEFLRLFDPVLHGDNLQFVFPQPQDQFISCANSQGVAKRCRDDDAPIFIHPHSCFFHDKILLSDIILINVIKANHDNRGGRWT